jgi:hypothetical protein
MKIDHILAITGLPGLYTMVTERKGGLIIEDIASGKRRFAPTRKHQFAPLESMAIYTDDGEAEPLRVVFTRMLEQQEDNPAPAPNASKDDLFEYLADVLPNYDTERVHASDLKKLLKWYHFLRENDAFGDDEEE